MKKLVLLVLLFYSCTASAQYFYAGADGGEMSYKFRQQVNALGVTYFTYGAFGQYNFNCIKPYSVEANLYYAPTGVNTSTGYFDWIRAITTSGYFCVNPFPKQRNVLIQFKAGFFYTQYLISSMQPQGDYGPSIGFYAGLFKLAKRQYLGIDLSYMVGLQSYLIQNTLPYEIPPAPYPPLVTGSTNITYLNFALKYIHKF